MELGPSSTRLARFAQMLVVFALAVLSAPAGLAAMPTASAEAQASLSSDPASARDYTFEGAPIAFPTISNRNGAAAIPIDDAGLSRLLAATHAAVLRSGDGVTITTSDGRTARFIVGDTTYVADGEAHRAPFPPFRVDGTVVVPFAAVVDELGLAPTDDGATTVLQPQLQLVEVATMGDATYVALRSALPVDARVVPGGDSEHAVVALSGVGATALADRSDVTIAVSGTVANPTTALDVSVAARSVVAVVPGGDPDTVVLEAIPPSRAALANARPSDLIENRPAPMRTRLIVIDPGHGGSDPGSIHHGLVEKDLDLELARRVRSLLVQRGWDVRMTRDADRDVTFPNPRARDELQARDDLANELGARLFVSLHGNAFTLASANGTTTYWYTARSQAFADAVHDRLAATLPTSDDGVRHENYYVIRHAEMPAILIEAAFLSNPTDARRLASPDFLQRFALAVADGIDDFVNGAHARDR